MYSIADYGIIAIKPKNFICFIEFNFRMLFKDVSEMLILTLRAYKMSSATPCRELCDPF